MLQPSSISSLLSSLIQNSNGDPSIRPHTAILTLLDSSELYAVSTTLLDTPPTKSAVASILDSTAAATGSTLPSNGKPAPLTLDERAACLSAIAVTAWRQATEGSKLQKQGVVMPGASVPVAKHAVTGMTQSSRELVPLLLESDLGRILVMPIVPASPTLSLSRSELAEAQETHEDTPPYGGEGKPFMLLTLNASSEPPIQGAGSLSAPQGRGRLRSGGTTPTSTTPTPSRSPVSDVFPTSVTGGEGEAEAAGEDTQAREREQKVWSGLYAQAKALARVLAPSLTKCGVGQGHHIDDQGGEGRRSGVVSDDDGEA